LAKESPVLIDHSRSLQDQFAPKSICFGCGPVNWNGLRLKSFVDPSNEPVETPNSGQNRPRLFANFQPQPFHTAFEGVVNGGIISVLLDCHLNWTGAWQLMIAGQLNAPPSCVTAKYEVTFQAPTPIHSRLRLEAWIEEISGRKAVVNGRLGPVAVDDQNGQSIQTVTATAHGTFVAVNPGHPAYHRW
jgi:acyl-coenzyme A thioesterase PaaI-like protein